MESSPSQDVSETTNTPGDAYSPKEWSSTERTVGALAMISATAFIGAISIGLSLRKNLIQGYKMQYSLLQASLEMQRNFTFKTTSELDRLTTALNSLKRQMAVYEGDFKEVRRCLNHDSDIISLKNKLQESERRRKKETDSLQSRIKNLDTILVRFIEESDRKAREWELQAKSNSTELSGFDNYLKVLKNTLQQKEDTSSEDHSSNGT